MFPSLFALIKAHAAFVNTIYSKVIESCNGYMFCKLYNLRAYLIFSSTRVFQDKSRTYFIAKGDGYTRSFLAKKQNIMSYTNGISNRGKSLSKIYSLEAIKFESDDVIVDCGANIGDFEIYFKESGIIPHYYAIEPSESDFRFLEKNLIFPNSRAFNVALCDSPGLIDFYVSSSFGDSSIIQPPKFTSVVKARGITLDEFVAENSLDRIKLFKLEAEGAEPEILLGAVNCLDRIEFISADLGFERGIKQETTLPEVANFLIQRGFEMLTFNSPRIVCLFRNTKFCQ